MAMRRCRNRSKDLIMDEEEEDDDDDYGKQKQL